MKTKQKTHKSTRKRVKTTKSGKLLRGRTGGRHLLSQKRPKKKRRASQLEEVSRVDAKRFKKLIGD